MRLPAVAVLPPHDDRRTSGTAYEARRASNLVEGLAGPAITGWATAGAGEAMFVAQGVDAELRRMVVLCAAEVFAARRDARTDIVEPRDDEHTPRDMGVAVSEELVARTTPDCALVCAAVDELFELGTLTCSTLDSMHERFGNATIRTLTLIVGWLASVSLILDRRSAPARADD